MFRRWLLLAASALPAMLATLPAWPAQSPLRGTLSVQGRQVPLPEGGWVQAGSASAADGVVSVALLQLRDGAVEAGVLVQASPLGIAPGWGDDPACTRTDLPFARIHYRSDHDGSCAYVTQVGQPASGEAVDAAWHSAMRTAAAQGWTLPPAWRIVVVRVTAPVSGVQVRYAFARDAAGEPSAAALVAWAPAAWEQVERGLHNQLDPHRPLPPLASPGPAPSWGLPPPGSGGLELPQPVWKTISFRVISTTFDFTANLIALGEIATAAALSTVPILIGPWIYLGHELAWEHFGAPAGAKVTLPGLGDELPWPAAAPPGGAS